MTRGKSVLIVAVLIAVAFLSGLLLGYWQGGDTRASLRVAERDRDSLQVQVRMCRLRDLAALMYVETTRRNYGLASEYAGRYFDEVRDLGQAQLSAMPSHVRDSMSDLLARRDAISQGLARSEPGATQQVQALFLDTFHRTQLEDASPVSGPAAGNR
ncbi:MAG TPA: hypothetical protein PLP42_18550 [Acidobacteriota bacterium]|nr:hypothetical protein [Acidobacteriota bacterium]